MLFKNNKLVFSILSKYDGYKYINLFFDTINNVDNVDKKQLEKDLIDRCFEEIDFTKEENLKDLYIKLNLYKNEMSNETKKYSSKLFKYCLENYINKSKKG